MPRRQNVFFTVASTVWLLLHAFVALRLSGGALAWAGTLVLGLAPLVALFTHRAAWVGFTAMGFSSILIVLVLVAGFMPPAVLVAGAAVLTVAGLWGARRWRVVRVDVPIADLPSDLEGLRIVQISDLHIGPTLKRDWVEGVVATANAAEPDLVVLTGDLADGFPPALRGDVAPLADLQAPLGKFFVTGNHEYYWDPVGWTGEAARLGFDVLANTHRLLQRGNGRLLLAGVPDRTAHASDPAAALAGAPDSDVKVLLAHQPRSAYAARAAGFDLQLSGHTHGGQYFPFSLLVRLFQPFVAGLHRLEDMWLYVSRGTGYWGPPLRLGAPGEITVIELVRA